MIYREKKRYFKKIAIQIKFLNFFKLVFFQIQFVFIQKNGIINLLVHYPSAYYYYEGGAKNPLKGIILMKFLWFCALRPVLCVS